MVLKTKIRQLLGVALSVALLVGVTGCGSQETDKSNEASKSEEKVQNSVQESSVETSTVPETEEITYPLDTDDELTFWSYRATVNGAYDDWTESPFHTGLAEKTGVKLDWQFPVKGVSNDEALNLLLMEDELPDIIHVGWKVGDAQMLIDEGLIWDLTEYLPKYAPDYWATINQEQYQDVLRAATTTGGRQFCVAGFVESDYNITYKGPMVRKDWLDECGLDEPVTLEDWEEMLKVFKEKYNATCCALDFQSGTGTYQSIYATWYIDDNQQVQFIQTQPEWKEYAEIMNRWWEAGYLDPDVFTIDTAGIRTKAANNQIGATYGAMSLLTNLTMDAENANSGAEWIGVEYPREAEGVPTCYIQTTSNEWSACVGAAITKSCSEEELILALKFLNYGYTEEGKMYWNFGEEGVTYTLNSEGQPEWTELVTNDPLGLDGAVTKYSAANGGVSIQLARQVQMKNSKNAADAVYKWINNTEAGKHLIPPAGQLVYTEEENLTYSERFGAINTYVSEMAMKFITGEVSLDEYDDFVEHINELGVEDCRKVRQSAVDRFNSK